MFFIIKLVNIIKKTKKRQQKQARYCYHQEIGEERTKEYYRNSKENMQEKARNKYRELSDEKENRVCKKSIQKYARGRQTKN